MQYLLRAKLLIKGTIITPNKLLISLNTLFLSLNKLQIMFLTTFPITNFYLSDSFGYQAGKKKFPQRQFILTFSKWNMLLPDSLKRSSYRMNYLVKRNGKLHIGVRIFECNLEKLTENQNGWSTARFETIHWMQGSLAK